jgi:uncharacterized protein (TIGR02588 family)
MESQASRERAAAAGSAGEPPDGERVEGGAVDPGERQRAESQPGQRESRLQILVTWLSGLLLLSVVGYLVWEGSRPPVDAQFQARIGTVREVDENYYLAISVTNTGGLSVQSLGVSLELREGTQVVDRAGTVLDWLPEGSTRTLVLILEEDPREHRTVVSFDGYQVP